jgi:hypothetical protein
MGDKLEVLLYGFAVNVAIFVMTEVFRQRGPILESIKRCCQRVWTSCCTCCCCCCRLFQRIQPAAALPNNIYNPNRQQELARVQEEEDGENVPEGASSIRNRGFYMGRSSQDVNLLA